MPEASQGSAASRTNFESNSFACLGVPLREAQKLPGKAFVMLRARPGIFGFLEGLRPFVRFLCFGNLLEPFIVSSAVIASAKGRRDQDKANKQRTNHRNSGTQYPSNTTNARNLAIIYRVPAGKAAHHTAVFPE
jgi:hypothetical protein